MTGLSVRHEPYMPGRREWAALARLGKPWGTLVAAWTRHVDLLRNAGALVATTGVTSVLGFAYWAVAARLFSQRAVGYGSATVSAMTLLGTVGMLGLGTVLIGELPRRTPRAGLVAAALLTSGVASLVFGLAFILAAPSLSDRFRDMNRSPGQILIFVVGVMVTGVSLVFDQATIGLMRGGLQLSRNMVFAVSKLFILPGTALVLHDSFGIGITGSWVCGTVLSLIFTGFRLGRCGTSILPRPDWAVLRGLGRTALAHNWLNLAASLPQTLMPVLVTVIVSPSANAAFYAAWTLSSFLKIIPTHLATVLFAVAASDPQLIARKLRFTLRLSLLIGIPLMVALGLGAHIVLSLFGPSYAHAGAFTLCVLAISYLPTIPRTHYMAVCRATGHVSRAAAVLTAATAAEVIASAIGGATHGLTGVALGLLIVYLVEGCVTTPPVLRSAMGRGRHRRSERDVLTEGVGADRSPYRPDSAALMEAEYRRRQMTGIASLISISNVTRTSSQATPASPLESDAKRAASRWSREVGVPCGGLVAREGDHVNGKCIYLSWFAGAYKFRGRFCHEGETSSAYSLDVLVRVGSRWLPACSKAQIAHALSKVPK